MVAIGVNQSRIGGKPYGIVLTGIDRPVRVKIQGRYECNNGVQFCACGYRESEWPSGPKGRRFKSCHLDQKTAGNRMISGCFLCILNSFVFFGHFNCNEITTGQNVALFHIHNPLYIMHFPCTICRSF